MRTGVRLAAFAAALAAVGGGAALVGATLDPVHEDGGPGHGEAHAGAADDHGADAAHGEAVPAGLAVAEDGLRLVPETTVRPRGRSVLAFRVVGADGRTVRDFDLRHARRMHLIVVRRDVALYRHLHPRMDAGGTWRTSLSLPAGGVYRAFADFSIDGRARTLATDLSVPGRFTPRPLPAVSSRASTSTVRVTLAGGELRAGREATLRFLARRRGGDPLPLQPYLGASGHLVALREGDLAFLHVHPVDADAARGRVAFGATFPSAGRYRLFLQVRSAGRVTTVAHTVEVEG